MSTPHEEIPNSQAFLGQALGIASILPVFGLFLGPTAMALGRKGWNRIKEDPTLPGKRQAVIAIILGAITTFVNLGLLYAVIQTVQVRETKAQAPLSGKSSPATNPTSGSQR